MVRTSFSSGGMVSFVSPAQRSIYRGAIIGLGNVALNGHLPGWKKMATRFRITAGVDSEVERRDLFAKAFPETACTDSIADLPADLDFVDICTPPHTHFEMVTAALERGWNVLCEKPLVLTTSQLDQIRTLTRQSGRVVFTVHNWKFAPICRRVSDLIRSGALGQLLHCDWQVLRNGPSITTTSGNWRLDPEKAGGGILVDHGWHAFYLMHEWMGLSPCAVQATLENRRYADWRVEDTAVISVRFAGANGHSPTASIFLTWASPQRRNVGTIQGSLARLNIEDDVLSLVRNDGGRERFEFRTGLSSGSHHPDWFELVADEFAGELDNVSHRGANLNIAEICLRLVEQSRRSSRVRECLPL